MARNAQDGGPIAMDDTTSASDSRLIVDVSTFPDTPSTVTAELGAILNSVWFGYWG